MQPSAPAAVRATSRNLLGLNLVVAAAYVLASELALGLLRHQEAAIVWFASAVGLAALLLRGPAAMPGVAAGALVCAFLGGKSPLVAPAIAALTTLQIAATWWLLVRVLKMDTTLKRVRDVLLLALVGATVSPAVNALRILVATWWREGGLPDMWVGFAEVVSLGEVVGILLVAPVVLLWLRPGAAREPRCTGEWTLYLVTVIASVAVFGSMLRPMMHADSLPFALFPLAFWAAFRYGPRQTATVMALAGLTAILCHGMGQGPFVHRTIANHLTLADVASLYLFLAVLSVTSMLFAVAQQERQAAEARLRASESALRESEEKYRLLVDNQTDLVMRLCAKTGRVLYASPSHEAFFGRPVADLLGREFGDAIEVHRDDRDAVTGSWSAVCCAPFAAAHESRVMTAQGWRWLAWSARAVLDRDGRPDFVVTVGRDVTDRRRAEEQSRQHLQQLAHVSRVSSMGEMASAIAHEINQPLTAISNYAAACVRMLADGRVSRDEALDMMRRIASEAQRAGEIVRKLRGFVRGDEGQLAAVEVDFLVAEVLRLATPEARQNGVELSWAPHAPGLPRVLADSIQVQQVILNLVRNAVESIAAGDAEPRRVTLSAAATGDGMVRIDVRDTGPGIPEGELEKVFEPFYTTKADGIGIGLALSRSIAEAHGGRLWATSSPEGATFHLSLPTAEELQHADAA